MQLKELATQIPREFLNSKSDSVSMASHPLLVLRGASVKLQRV